MNSNMILVLIDHEVQIITAINYQNLSITLEFAVYNKILSQQPYRKSFSINRMPENLSEKEVAVLRILPILKLAKISKSGSGKIA